MPSDSLSDREQPLEAWNETGTAYPRDASLASLFAAQAARSPDATALVFGDERLSYAELEARANQLARFLQREGVAPGDRVGLLVSRSPAMVVGMLAILDAGAAYLPLDSDNPDERLAFLIEDAGVTVLLTEADCLEDLPDRVAKKARVVCLDTDWSEIANESSAPLELAIDALDLAYVIYTSGSTGQPKGVCIPHRAVTRLVLDTDYVPLTPDDRVAQASNSAFDAATFEIWGALLNGARLVGIPKDVMLSPRRFEREIREAGVSCLFVTTALFNQIASEVPGAFGSLKHLMFGGEAVNPAWVRAVLDADPPERLLHVYGPTENTTFSTWYEVEEVREDDLTVPIGRPIANTTAYVLDEHQQPVPIGVSGELCLGGDGLALAYLDRPELTAEKFVDNPFSEAPGARLYRTGDRVRQHANGTIEFQGRFDHQVKLRGFRIELGEIESALLRHPGVRQAVVLVREDVPGDRHLVAYVVADDTPPVTTAALADHTREALPAYMVPAAFVRLDELPLTANRKLDRDALPAPDGVRPELEERFVAPRTPVEQQIADIWSELLGLERIGVHDNFFELGGHSLLATLFVSRLRDRVGLELPLRLAFDSPTVSELAAATETGGSAIGDAPPLVPVPRDGELPLSFAQERAWFLHQLFPGNSAYHFEAAIRMRGPLDVGALEDSLSEIVRRHEIFRTTFPALEGRPVQVFHPAKRVALPRVDLSDLPTEQRDSELARRIEDEFLTPFDLSQLPLVRWTLVQLDSEEHVLIQVEHHLVHDGWSFNVFLGELKELYNAFAGGRPSPLPELPIQFADFAQGQREWMQGEVVEHQLGYWKKQLAGCPSLLELPWDRPRPAVQSFRGRSLSAELPIAVCDALRRIARDEGVSLYMVMLAGFFALLRRYTGAEDICVGAGVANRRWREIEGVIGMVLNTMALRGDLSGNPTFHELLSRVQAICTSGYEHQDVPFDMVVDAVRPERNLSYSPLYQTMFSFHDSPLPDFRLDGLETEVREGLSFRSAKFDLNVYAIPRSEQRVRERSDQQDKRITLRWEYNTDLFDADTMDRMLGSYQTLLESIARDPAQRISALSTLTERERRQQVEGWNETRTAYPRDASIGSLFEAQALRSSQSTALRFGDQTLSYAELEARSNQLAHFLVRLGVDAGQRVGLCVSRSPAMVVGMLGILKAGAAYLPIDPDDPAERLAFVIEDAGAEVLLTEAACLDALPQPHAKDGARTVCLDSQWSQIARESPEALLRPVAAGDLAYVIYTSGSTGRPKGVCVPHRAVIRLVMNTDYVQLTPADRVAQASNSTFDATTFEIWGALLNGARLVGIPKDVMLSPKRFAREIRESGISAMFMTSTLFNQIASEVPDAFGSLTHLLVGGEALKPEWVRAVLSAAPPKRLLNGYGPTENTTFSLCHEIEEVPEGDRSIPIGRPIANTTAYVLDERMQPVAIGVSGELCLGGDGLALEYLNRPELTAEKFVPNPFSDEPRARLYRTGDRVRQRADGAIEFQGRFDHQVKLRGFRIELGEIETVLLRHPGVRQAVVLVREDVPGDRRLVAYVVADDAPPVATTALADHTREALPAYMVPAAFVRLDALPLTANRKLDRAALPAPDGVRPELEERFVAPRTPVEEQIADIWSELLGLERIGVHDNFFELGGHSLLATRVIPRLQDRFRVELSLRELFEHPTTAELSDIVEDARARGAEAPDERIIRLARLRQKRRKDTPS